MNKITEAGAVLIMAVTLSAAAYIFLLIDYFYFQYDISKICLRILTFALVILVSILEIIFFCIRLSSEQNLPDSS